MSRKHSCSINTVYDWAVRHSVPLDTLFELTHRCNLRCSHCYVVDRSENELTFNEVTDILDQLAAENCLFLTFSGGECLLREDFLDICRYARGIGFALKVFTNGTLITESVAREMAKLRPLQVGMSIYGADAATHDGYTGVPGSFLRSLHAFELLKKHDITTIAKCLAMKGNVRRLGDMRKLAMDLGAIFQFDPVVTPMTDGNRAPLQYQISEADLYWLFSGETAEPEDTREMPLAPPEPIICGAGRNCCCISPGGEVYPCVALPAHLGNLRKQSFAEVWGGAKATELRNFRFSDLHNCVHCPDVDYCTRCWGLAAVESGDYLGAAHPNCRIARVRHRISVERGAARVGG